MYWTYSYGPISDPDAPDGVGGVLVLITETTKAVTAQRESEERYRTLFESMDEGFCVLQLIFDEQDRPIEYRYIEINPAFEQQTGMRDALGKTIRKLVPGIEPFWFDIYCKVALTGEPTRFVDHANAMGRWFNVYAFRVGEPHRRQVGVLFSDITKHKEAEANLRQSEARHRQIINSATDYAIIASDLDGQVTSWNEGARRLLGWSEDEMLGQPVHLFFTPEDVAADEPGKEMRSALESGRGIDERWHQRNSGERFWASGELTPLRDDEGVVTGFVKVMQDRTEHRRAEDTLRRYGALVESMTEGVSLSNEHGIIIYTNPAENRMFGYEPGELVGQRVTVQNAYEPDENTRRVEDVIAQLKTYGSWEGEWRNRRKDGTTFITASRITTVEIDGLPHWLCVQRDITQAKRVEEQQKLLINELNHRVKNTLATVQSIATQTFRDVDEESRPKLKAFEERLFALARAHDVLTRENWEGAELGEIITEVLEPYRRLAGERFEIRGPHLRLNPSMAVALAMALHELATNASKYGALSVPKGRVSIRWTRTSGETQKLSLQWRESHGPSVLPPTRRGFGTRLIERSLAADLGGDVRLIYDPSGVICRVEAPLNDQSSERDKR